MAQHARPTTTLLARFRWPIAAAAGLVVLAVTVATVVVLRGGQAGDTPAGRVAGQTSALPSADGVPPPPGTTPSASAAGSPTASAPGSAPPKPAGSVVAAPPARFVTLKPGAALPSGVQCASFVRAKPSSETKNTNRKANQTTGHPIGTAFFGGDDARANTRIAPRVDGQFTGSTRDILRWAACKWGIDEDIVLAQAAIESWWQQGTLGDWSTDSTHCAPGRGLGVDGKPGQCPESFGILQNRYPYEKPGWPGIANSTALNADLAYGIWRVCYEGYEGWLNTAERGQTYTAGDAWGCVGRWFSGRWHTQPSEEYIDRVKGYLAQRIWETPNFQQP